MRARLTYGFRVITVLIAATVPQQVTSVARNTGAAVSELPHHDHSGS